MDTAKTLSMKIGRIACCAFTLLLPTTRAFAQTAKQETLRSIRQADYFAIGRVGFAAAIPDAEKAIWLLIKAKDEKSLVALAKDKNIATQLYALVGLRYLNSAQYKPLADELTRSKATVQTLSGCIATDKKVSVVASSAAGGAYSKALERDMEAARK